MTKTSKPSIKTGNTRLLKLADFLDGVPATSFYMGTWATASWRDGADRQECGTTGCAIGWASTMPYFRKLGLRMRTDADGINYPEIKGYDYIDVAEPLFGLEREEAMALFSPHFHSSQDSEWDDFPTFMDDTPKQVACKIREFVARRKSPRRKP